MFEQTFLEGVEKTLTANEFDKIRFEIEPMWTPNLLKKIRKQKDPHAIKSMIYVELLTSKRKVALSRMFSRLRAIERAEPYKQKEKINRLAEVDKKFTCKIQQIKNSLSELRQERDSERETIIQEYVRNRKKHQKDLKEQFYRLVEGIR